MRKTLTWIIYILIGVAILISLGAAYVYTPILGKLPEAPNIDLSISPQSLKADVVFLADSCYPRSFENQPMLQKANRYITGRLEELGYETRQQRYLAKKIEHQNIIATIGPDTEETIVIGAHYDVCGTQPGADDNASAVAGLLGLAELFKKYEDLLSYKVEFVAYSLEEPPFFPQPEDGKLHSRRLYGQGRCKNQTDGLLGDDWLFLRSAEFTEFPNRRTKSYVSYCGQFHHGSRPIW